MLKRRVSLWLELTHDTITSIHEGRGVDKFCNLCTSRFRIDIRFDRVAPYMATYPFLDGGGITIQVITSKIKIDGLLL